MSPIEHEYTREPVCPYCGREVRDAWEINFGPGCDGETEIECGWCERTFTCVRHVTVEYSTEEIEESADAQKGGAS